MPSCRLCSASVTRSFLDLGEMPLANSLPAADDPPGAEERYPLHARVCDRCLLVQVDDAVAPAVLFRDYPYFSSYSSTWLAHAETFVRHACESLGLDEGSFVIEVGSNDGYLLRNFVERGVPVLGIEPAANVAAVARAAGVPTDTRFFSAAVGREVARAGPADLVVANNVLAHVPDLHDFVEGLARVLKPSGVVSIEVPHLLRLVEDVAFDTIYHEHFSYFSLRTARRALAEHGLEVFAVEPLSTHGGSLRLWAGHEREPGPSVDAVLASEDAAALEQPETYDSFAGRSAARRDALVAFLQDAATKGRRVAAYGAAAKGATLLNFAGVTPREVSYVADRNPWKQGRVLPGSRVPIVPPHYVAGTQPDYLLVLPWNLRQEIEAEMSFIRGWGGELVVPSDLGAYRRDASPQPG